MVIFILCTEFYMRYVEVFQEAVVTCSRAKWNDHRLFSEHFDISIYEELHERMKGRCERILEIIWIEAY